MQEAYSMRPANLTQVQLAKEAKVSVGYIKKLERFLYSNLEGAVAAVLAEHLDTDVSTISSQYRQARLIALSSSNTNIDLTLLNTQWYTSIKSSIMNYDSHPHVTLRTAAFNVMSLPVSQIKYCELTGIHAHTLARYENFSTPTMPRSVRSALVSVLGAPEDIVKLVNDLVLDWFRGEW